MNRAVRRVALALALVFLALVINLNYVQLARSDDLSADRRNLRNLYEELGIRRGEILARDGTVLAASVATGDPRYRFRRRYPQGSLFGHITGHYTSSAFCESAGLERTFNAPLTGEDPPRAQNFVDDLLGRQRDGNVLRLTIDPELQRLARRALRGQRGSVALLNSETGGVLALYSNPAYDPNAITRGVEDCKPAYRRLVRDRRKPLEFRATKGRLPPGSTFKIITASAGLEAGLTPSTSFRNPRALDLPDTNQNLRNYGGGVCGGGSTITLRRGFLVSCNTTFAQVALKIGIRRFDSVAQRFGLDRPLDFDLPTVPSCMRQIPDGCEVPPDLARPFVAYSGIGQYDVGVTPLQMALAGAVIGNGGYLVRPYLVERILSADGAILSKTKPRREGPVLKKATLRAMKEMMIGVVRFGTAAGIGFRDRHRGIIGGKTGTAEAGGDRDPHVWFVAWGPKLAICVNVENGGTVGPEATGARVAGPIARTVLERAIAKYS